MHKYIYFTYLLSLIIFSSAFGMQLTKRSFSLKTKFIRTAIVKSPELDAIRQKLDRGTWDGKNGPQEIVDISQGKIRIKEEIPYGKRYGTCHNYAFTKTMGIVGQTPKILNILGQTDYYGNDYLKLYNFFDLLEPGAVEQPGDHAVYLTQGEKGFKEITHTGIVVGDDCIESKWGTIRAVFEHPLWYVPAGFGDHCRYFRPKISGDDLLVEVQKKLQQKQIKKRYDTLARRAQKQLFDNIKQYEQDQLRDNFGEIYSTYEQDQLRDNFGEIYSTLEFNMNVHLDVPDENGITPLMHAERIGCQRLKEMFEIYQKYNE